MVDAVANRLAPSVAGLRPNGPGAPVESPVAAAVATAATALPDLVIVDLSERAQAELVRQDGDPSVLSTVEERAKLMTEYTAVQQELVWLADRTAAQALDEMFQATPRDDARSADDRAQFDRDMQRREELMPRYAELVRMLGALPGQSEPER